MNHDELLTTKETAKMLGIWPETLCRWRMAGLGPRFLKEGARWVRYRRSDIEKFLATK